MKKLILIIGTLLIVLNTAIGFVLTDYSAFNLLLANASLLFSTGIIYLTVCSKIANGFKIGLTVIFFFTGIARYLCMAFTSEVLADNMLIIVVIGILFFEIVCLSASIMISKKVMCNASTASK